MVILVFDVCYLTLEIPRRYVVTYNGRDFYTLVNLWIIASNGVNKLGTATFPIDTSWLRWPRDAVRLIINLTEVKRKVKDQGSTAEKTYSLVKHIAFSAQPLSILWGVMGFHSSPRVCHIGRYNSLV